MIPETFERLRNSDRAVSPVIGVILMVAITVILAAVIAAFVLGFGADTDAPPQASLSLDQDGDNLTIAHTGGEDVDLENVYLRGVATNSSPVAELDGVDATVLDGGNTTTVEGVDAPESGELNVVWDAGDESHTLASIDWDGT